MNCATGTVTKMDISESIEKFRILFGLMMMLSGLYFGLFTAGISESLGFISVLASPFVMVTDK